MQAKFLGRQTLCSAVFKYHLPGGGGGSRNHTRPVTAATLSFQDSSLAFRVTPPYKVAGIYYVHLPQPGHLVYLIGDLGVKCLLVFSTIG